MHCADVLPMCRRPKLRAWLGAVAVLLLLAAQTFAIAHQLDRAAHTNGDSCAICVSAASLGASATAHAIEIGIEFVPPLLAAVEQAVFVASARVRPSARGPPAPVLTY
jgi:CHASE2 domain-containing sensor protein